jgi:hypothetical protein
MIDASNIVFLFDVDNTLLNNDRIQEDLLEYLRRSHGEQARDRYWAIFEELRNEIGYADYLGALRRYRLEDLHDPQLQRMANWMVDYPFADPPLSGRARCGAICPAMGPGRHPVRR